MESSFEPNEPAVSMDESHADAPVEQLKLEALPTMADLDAFSLDLDRIDEVLQDLDRDAAGAVARSAAGVAASDDVQR